MLILRKTDLYLQVALGILMVLSIPVLFIYGFLAGLLLLGLWQLVSALLNTPAFLAYAHKKQIVNYWKWTAAVLGTIILCLPLSYLFDPDDVQVLFWTAVVGSLPVAVFYMHIYGKLINHIELRRELSGVTKSRH
jgi:hypothetical protein